jgi:hypothetical protein
MSAPSANIVFPSELNILQKNVVTAQPLKDRSA